MLAGSHISLQLCLADLMLHRFAGKAVSCCCQPAADWAASPIMLSTKLSKNFSLRSACKAYVADPPGYLMISGCRHVI
jgi:hypothetical protein